MTFDEWYNEIEGYDTRGERFDEWMLSSGDGRKGKDWLKAAYNAGFKEGSRPPADLPIPTPPYVKYPTRERRVVLNAKSCSKCGINLSGVMGYVCYDLQCPTQMRISAGGGSTLSGAHSVSYGYSDPCVGLGDIK